MKIKYSAEVEAIIAADPDLQRFREIADRDMGRTETLVEQVLVAVEIYLRDSGRELPQRPWSGPGVTYPCGCPPCQCCNDE